jgi:hypothetical protein
MLRLGKNNQIARASFRTGTTSSYRTGFAVVRLEFRRSYFHLLDGRVYAYEDIAGRLKAAGFHNMRQKKLLKAPGTGLITGML